MLRWHAKIGVTIGTFLIPFLATIAPIKVEAFVRRKGATGKKILDFLICFGGGVFFATYLMHMSVEAKDILVDYLLKPKGITYPLAELIMGLGFFLVLVVDKAIMSFSKPSTKIMIRTEGPHVHVAYTAPNNEIPECIPITETRVSGGSCGSDAGSRYSASHPVNGLNIALPAAAVSHAGHAHCHEAVILQSNPNSTRAIVLMVALSLHRIFEGMGIGLQHTATHVWHLYIAIMCHEVVIGFSLGLRLIHNNWPVRRIIVSVFFISLIQPIGVSIGTMMSELSEPSSRVEIANGVLQCIATGTFIYVTFFEILGEQVEDAGLLEVLAIFLGFAAMAAMELIPEDRETDLLGQDAITDNSTLV